MTLFVITCNIPSQCVFVLLVIVVFDASQTTMSCRDVSYHLRHDGGLCFEIPPWQHQPVDVDGHLMRIKETLGNNTHSVRQTRSSNVVTVNSDITHYMDTVIAPFLDTYHRNIQNGYQQHTNKILRRIKDEINAALKRKHQIYTELTNLADKLMVPEMCDEERRAIRVLASRNVAQIYRCTEEARHSMAKMGKYAEEVIAITRNRMQFALEDVTRMTNFEGGKAKWNQTSRLKELSKAAVSLGYELDLSLTNSRRHGEQSCEKLTNCCARARKNSEDSVNSLRDQLYQCVYA